MSTYNGHKNISFEDIWQIITPIAGWLPDIATGRALWANARRAKRAVEVGTYCGKSACLQLLSNPELQLWCIDTFAASSPELDGRDTFEECVDNLGNLGVLERCHMIRMDSAVAHKECPRRMDYAFIDGGHDEATVALDIKNFVNLIRPHGVMIFHDYYWDGSQWPGVKAAVDAASAKRLIGEPERICSDTAQTQVLYNKNIRQA